MLQGRIVFEAIGSRGDVAPLLDVAAEMRRRGHQPTLLAPRPFAAEAAVRGVEFVGTTDLHLHDLGRPMQFDDFYFPTFRAVVDYFDKAALSGQRAVVVSIEKTATSNLLCQRDGLPGVRIHLTPFKVRSLVAPPWPYARGAIGPGAQRYLQHTLPSFFHASDHHPGLVAHINQRRQSLGLPCVESATAPEPHLAGQGCFFPDWFCAPAVDWPANMQMLGFPLAAPLGELPKQAREFLDAGPPPFVFTTGTGVARVDEFFEHARDCCAQLGQRAVFLSPHIGEHLRRLPSILAIDYADLGLLLPRCSLFVHHGGIGTVSRALEAAIPQIISPLRFDQPDNARRLEALGLAVRLERGELSGASLASLALQLSSDSSVRQQRQQAQQQVRAVRAVQACADLLESCLPCAGAAG